MDSTIDIVVARYNEDLAWLEPLAANCIIYNKGEPVKHADMFKRVIEIPNLGRESYTYLYHIINNYDDLADVTLFIQGHINDHIKEDSITFVHRLISEVKQYGHTKNAYAHDVGIMSALPRLKLADKWPKLFDTGLYFGEWLSKVLAICNRTYDPHKHPFWYINALFGMSRNTIQAIPKKSYTQLLQFVNSHVEPEAAHYFERAWYEIFVGSLENGRCPPKMRLL